MTNKLKFLTKISLKRKINTKWFVIANVIFAILIIGLLNMDAIINFFGGDFDETQIVYVNDSTNKTYDILKMQNDNYKNLIDENENAFELKRTNKTVEKIFKDEKNKKAWYLTIENDDKNYLKATLTSEGYINTTSYAGISTIINNTKTIIAMEESNVSKEELAKISSPVALEREILDESKKSEDENVQMIMSTLFPLLILPFFALTIFLVQMVGAEINDEKTTRGMEIIISNVSPKTHIFSKVLASNLFVIIQGLLLIFYVGVAFYISHLLGTSLVDIPIDFNSLINILKETGIINKLIYIIPLTIILIILSFMAYSIVAGILASMTVNIEDFNQLQSPIMLISIAGYYLAIMAAMFDGSIFIRIISYIPFLSVFISPTLFLLGQITIFDMLISISILGIFVYIMLKFGLKVYKVGILNYSSGKVWNKFLKAIKNKN